MNEYIQTCIHTYIHTCTYKHAHTQTHTCIAYILRPIHIVRHVHTHTHGTCIHTLTTTSSTNPSMHIHVYLYMNTISERIQKTIIGFSEMKRMKPSKFMKRSSDGCPLAHADDKEPPTEEGCRSSSSSQAPSAALCLLLNSSIVQRMRIYWLRERGQQEERGG